MALRRFRFRTRHCQRLTSEKGRELRVRLMEREPDERWLDLSEDDAELVRKAAARALSCDGSLAGAVRCQLGEIWMRW